MIGAAEGLAEPGRGIRADSQEPVSQADLAQVPYPVQALADSDSHRRRLCLAGQCGEFLDQLVSLGILDIEAHVLPFYPDVATMVPSRSGRRQPVADTGRRRWRRGETLGCAACGAHVVAGSSALSRHPPAGTGPLWMVPPI